MSVRPIKIPYRGNQPRIRTEARLPIRLPNGDEALSKIFSFDGLADGKEHFAIKFGTPCISAPLVRVHSECMTGDVFGSCRCDCGPQLHEALGRLADEGGYLLYMRQEGRGIGLYQKIDAYRLQELGQDTFEANRALGRNDDERDYTAAAQMLSALGLSRIDLLSNNPDKRAQLERAGISVGALLPTGVFPNDHNISYLEAKVRHSGHAIDFGKISRMTD